MERIINIVVLFLRAHLIKSTYIKIKGYNLKQHCLNRTMSVDSLQRIQLSTYVDGKLHVKVES